jgi:hypothetical protein
MCGHVRGGVLKAIETGLFPGLPGAARWRDLAGLGIALPSLNKARRDAVSDSPPGFSTISLGSRSILVVFIVFIRSIADDLAISRLERQWLQAVCGDSRRGADTSNDVILVDLERFSDEMASDSMIRLAGQPFQCEYRVKRRPRGSRRNDGAPQFLQWVAAALSSTYVTMNMKL